jgi:hypothetical protein
VNSIDSNRIYYEIVLTSQKKIPREKEKRQGYLFSGIGHRSVM